MKTSRFLTIAFFIHFCNENIVTAVKSKWLEDYKNYLKDNFKEYQVLLLFDQNQKNENPRSEDIILEISKNVPTLKLSFDEATTRKSQELSELPSFFRPRTTIFIVIYLPKNNRNISELNGPIKFLSQLSEARRRPKVLIIFPQEEKSSTYLKLLKHMWSQRFLDVIVLELIEVETKNNYFSTTSKEIPILHWFNPFSKIYFKEPFRPSILWFPEKTHNLYGSEIKVGVIHLPPDIYLERNRTDHTIKPFGTEILLTEGLAKAMNFTSVWIAPKKKNGWGIPTCPKENSTGHFYSLMHNEINFLAIESARFTSCDEVLYEWSIGTEFQTALIVIPIIPDTSSQLLTNWKLFNAFVVISLFSMIWLVSRKLPFERRNWSLMQILQVVLGMETDHEPQNLAERIVFGSMLISCLMHSSFIYTALTDVSLSKTPGVKIETIKDVLSSNLQPVICDTLYAALYEAAEGSTRLLLDKSTQTEKMSYNCMKQLAKNKKLACIAMSVPVKWTMKNEKNSRGEPIMQIVREPIRSMATGYMLETGSPYVGQFDKRLLRFAEAGIIDKWRGTRFDGSSVVMHADVPGSERGSESALIYRQMSFVLLCGYSCTLISFLCELVFFYLRKRFKSNLRKRLQSCIQGSCRR